MNCVPPKQKRSAVIFVLVLLFLGAANVSHAKDITLTWDANQESDIAFYNIYLKDMETQEVWQEPGPAHDPAASTISQQILGLDDTRQYCFQITALNESNIESSPSEEVCTVVAPVDSDSDGDGYTSNQGDCDDLNASINPGAEDICGDGIDQDCFNGDEICPVDPANTDNDGDGLLDSVDPQPYYYNTPLDSDTAFVRQTFLDVFCHEPDTVGLNYWVGQLEIVGLDRSELVEQFLLSDEFQGNVAPLARLYFAYFNRLPDYSGLMYWIGRYKDGAEIKTISNSFASSAEFTSTYGSLSNGEFVSLVYKNVLGREADASGMAYWTGELDSSRKTRGQVMVGFSESAENKALMQHKIYVTMSYIGLLRRNPDQGGFNYWVSVMDASSSGLAMIDGFLYSNEYAARF